MKVGIPFFIWSFIYYVLYNKNLNIFRFFIDFINCDIESVFWFFPTILYLYCLIPIFSTFVTKKENRKLVWAIVLWIFIFQSVLVPISKIMHIDFPVILNNTIKQHSYIIFLLLGYLLSTTDDFSKRKRIVIYLLAIIGLLFRYIYTYVTSINNNELNDNLFQYEYFPSIFLAIGVFVFIKNINLQRFENNKLVEIISSCSFGIYLVHIIAIAGWKRILGLDAEDLTYRIILPIIVYMSSVFLVYILKKIPMIKKIVP